MLRLDALTVHGAETLLVFHVNSIIPSMIGLHQKDVLADEDLKEIHIYQEVATTLTSVVQMQHDEINVGSILVLTQ